MLHTGKQDTKLKAKQNMGPLRHSCVKCLHLFRLTFSEWPLVFVINTQKNIISGFRTFYIFVLMKRPDTHWYCKCVAMIDIFLRLYNTEDMFRQRSVIVD